MSAMIDAAKWHTEIAARMKDLFVPPSYYGPGGEIPRENEEEFDMLVDQLEAAIKFFDTTKKGGLNEGN